MEMLGFIFKNASFEKREFVFTQVLWRIRENITSSLLKDGYSYKYDISVPLEMFYQVIIDLRKRLGTASEVIRICGYGHLGEFCIYRDVKKGQFFENVVVNPMYEA